MKKDLRRPPASDDQIVALYWCRDESAIDETDRKYGPLIYGIAYHILCDKGDSEECQNDTYLRTWNAIPPTRPNQLQVFLSRITRGLALNRLATKRRQKRVPRHMTDYFEDVAFFASDRGSVEEEVSAAELARHINAFLESRTETERQIFVGRYYFGHSAAEVAESLHMTTSNVYKQLTKLKNDLKQYLNERGESID